MYPISSALHPHLHPNFIRDFKSSKPLSISFPTSFDHFIHSAMSRNLFPSPLSQAASSIPGTSTRKSHFAMRSTKSTLTVPSCRVPSYPPRSSESRPKTASMPRNGSAICFAQEWLPSLDHNHRKLPNTCRVSAIQWRCPTWRPAGTTG